MANKNRVQAAPYAFMLGSALTTGFQAVNALGLPFPCFMLRIVNLSSLNIIISYDGTTSNDILEVSGSLNITSQNNARLADGTALFPAGMKVYVKSTAAGTGTIYVAAYFQTV